MQHCYRPLALAILIMPMVAFSVRADAPPTRATTAAPATAEILSRLVRQSRPIMACAAEGASCKTDTDCCPGTFCSGGTAGAKVCVID
jgi:hypothetical protein